MIIRALFIVLGLALFCAASQPANAGDAVRMFLKDEPISLSPDQGYALIRTQSPWKLFDVVFMRVPSDDEMAEYEKAKQTAFAKAGKNAGSYDEFKFTYDGPPNLWSIPFKRSMTDIPGGRMLLAELPPGEYVFYGEGYSGFLYECLCLGTVRFTLKPGVVTDFGTIMVAYASEKSAIPELASVTGLGSAARIDYAVFALGVRPPAGGEVLPQGVDASRIQPAQFRAVGPFIDSQTTMVARLAPVPGVLAYDGGRVIDVTSRKEVPPN